MQASYSDITIAGAVTTGRFNENAQYDIRGNIMGLQRWGKTNNCNFGQIGDQHYYYNYDQSYNPTNKLQKVVENSLTTKGFVTASNGGVYQYDANGNLTADPNKGITAIAYNYLNLPTKVTFNTGNTIDWLYNSKGAKLRKTVKVAGVIQYTQNYINGIEYKNGLLEAIYHGEGRVVSANGALLYEYAMKDYLGNTRLMFGDRNNDGIITPDLVPELSEVTQENHFYPFGMNMDGVWENTPSIADNLYQYNGKEWNNDFGLGLNDYGARWYDPAIARFTTVDPLNEKMRRFTPYNYVFNNPMRFVDPDGMEPASGNDRKHDKEEQDKELKAANEALKKALLRAYDRAHGRDEYDNQITDYSKYQNETNESVQNDSDPGPDPRFEKGLYIVVLLASKGASGMGHMALMFGNEKNGWLRISKSGVNGGNCSGEGPASDPEFHKFNYISDALDGYYDNAAVFKINNIKKYNTSLDKMSKEAFTNYSVTGNNCGHACRDALISGGFNYTFRTQFDPFSQGPQLINAAEFSAPVLIYRHIIDDNRNRIITQISINH